ncbi:MAG: DDE-type integrase/transposase/recombinase [Nitrososphaerales archaeon]
MQSLEIRAQKGKEIAEMLDSINRIDETTYKVKSQSMNMYYEVLATERGWTCQCSDYRFRGVKCKHAWAVEYSFAIRKLVQKEVVIQPINISNCPKCNSDQIVKHGVRHNKFGDIQRFTCKNCANRFVVNLGFERMKHNPQAITSAMQLYFGGESLRHTRDSLKLLGTQVSYQTIHNWIAKYVSLMDKYLDKIQPQVGNAWRTDELYVKVRGNQKYLFALMDDETRFWIAQQVADHKGTSDVKPMFREAQRIAGKNPSTIISDGALNFAEATKIFYVKAMPSDQRTHHIRDITFDGERHNNKMERMNGELRDREKVIRGVKSVQSPIFKGAQIFHNYIRPHMSLEGQKTPAELAGIKVEGSDKWKTLIQNASAQKPNDITA